MYFIVVGMSFRTAPIEVREALSFSKDQCTEALSLLSAKESVAECALLSTCNRTEIYGLLREAKPSLLIDFIRDYHKYSQPLHEYLYILTGDQAVRRLCNVAAGLESMILGEPQIFGQVKDAYQCACDCQSAQRAFKELFPRVFSIVKRVRSKTRIGENNVSVSYAAVKLAQESFGSLAGRTVLIIGAGEMGELTVRNLVSNGADSVLVANRTFQKAVALSERFRGTPIMLHEIEEYIPKADIIISSVASPRYALTAAMVQKGAQSRANGPLFVLDIAVPRSIDPEIGAIDSMRLYNIDDLKNFSEANAGARQQQAQRAQAIIDAKVPDIMERLESYDIMPTILAIRSKAEEIRRERIDQALSGMAMSEKDKARIASLTKSMINMIMRHSETALREYSNNMNS